MKYSLFINSYSFGKNSISKWKKIASEFSFLETVLLSPEEMNSVLKKHIQSNDTVFLGGGDGTIHHLINSVFQSDDDFKRIKVGILGLGSSCSFLRSVPFTKKFKGIPTLTNLDHIVPVDIGHVKFKNQNGQWESKYFVANGSLGFLAMGNQLFNKQGGLTQFLKSISSEAANNYVFVKSLFKYQPAMISVNSDLEKTYLNIQFLKSKYYTGDYFFERQNSLQSGQIDFHLIEYAGRWNILKVFYHLTLKNEYESILHRDYLDRSITIKTQSIIPLELDGEIYYGNEFHVECIPQKLRIMSGVPA